MTDPSHSLPPDRADRLIRHASYLSLATGLVLVAIKLAATVLTGSVALLGTLMDSTADILASLATVIAVRVALKPADRSHRFGHGKAEAVAALFQSQVIAASATFVMLSAVDRLLNPKAVSETAVGVAAMALSLVLTAALVGFQRYVVRKTGSTAIAADSAHFASDLAIGIGLIVTLIAIAATGWLWIDPAVAAVVALALYRSAWSVGRNALNLVMDRELPAPDRDRIGAVVATHPEARGLHDLRTRSAGRARFIEFHLELDGALSLRRAHEVTDTIEARLKQAFPGTEVIIHQEPAGLDDDRLDHRIGARPIL